MRRTHSSSSPSRFAHALWRRGVAQSATTMATAIGAVCLLQSPSHRCNSTDASSQQQQQQQPSAASAPRPHRQLRLAVVRPDLLDDWIPELNDVDAQHISCTDAVTPVWWNCPKCGERYQATVRDRVARGPAACPHCSGAAGVPPAPPSGTTGSSFPDESMQGTMKGASLAETHPHLAARWDTERNGGLLPSHVSATSTRLAWWRPSADSPSSTSFRRPVFAFVYDAASPAEQAAATAEMEWGLLATIRRAARVEEAARLGSLPVTLSAAAAVEGQDSGAWQSAATTIAADTDESTLQFNDARRAGSAAGASLSSSPFSTAAISAEDAAAIAYLWKPKMKKLMSSAAAEQQQRRRSQDGAGPGEDETAAPFVVPREFFSYTFVPIDGSTSSLHPQPSHKHYSPSCRSPVDTAAVVRETLLNQYCDFVKQQRAATNSSLKGRSFPTPPPPVLDMAGESGFNADSPRASWISYFRLSSEEVTPKGFIDPGAALYFSDTLESAPSAEAAPVTVFPAKSSTRTASTSSKGSWPAPPLEEVTVTYYPRRPHSPPAWEDDVAGSVPPMPSFHSASEREVYVGNRHEQRTPRNTSPQVSPRRTRSATSPLYRIEAPFGSRVGDGAPGLAAEYEDDDVAGESTARQDIGISDAGAALAAELHQSESSTLRVGGASGKSTTSPSSSSSSSLVDSAIAALGSAYQTAQARGEGISTGGADPAGGEYYHRSTHAPSMRDGGRASHPAGGEKSTTRTPRKFRLSMPHEGLGGQMKFRSQRSREVTQKPAAGTAQDTSAKLTGANETERFAAPQTPRKVARARRVRKEAAETNKQAA